SAPAGKWAGHARSPLPVRQGFGPIRLPVRVTQKNDPEKICKQHFVALRGFSPTYLRQIDQKKTCPRGNGGDPWRPRPQRRIGPGRSPAAAAIITKSCI